MFFAIRPTGGFNSSRLMTAAATNRCRPRIFRAGPAGCLRASGTIPCDVRKDDIWLPRPKRVARVFNSSIEAEAGRQAYADHRRRSVKAYSRSYRDKKTASLLAATIANRTTLAAPRPSLRTAANPGSSWTNGCPTARPWRGQRIAGSLSAHPGPTPRRIMVTLGNCWIMKTTIALHLRRPVKAGLLGQRAESRNSRNERGVAETRKEAPLAFFGVTLAAVFERRVTRTMTKRKQEYLHRKLSSHRC